METTTTKPYTKSELMNPDVILHRHFLETLEDEARKAAVFDHPFLIRLSKGVYSDKGVRYAFIQFSHHVRVFTSCLAHILGMAPDIRDRLVLFDNLNEEMGRGNLVGTHYMLYLKMLSSMGVSMEEIERSDCLTSIELLNDALLSAVRKSFIGGLAWLGIGGELTIPNNFPYLSQGARRTFPQLDPGFFERHGQPDQGHNDDSNLLLAMQIKDQRDRDTVRSEVQKSLFLRGAVWDELADAAVRM
jgi:pyrroloquinoline quinone (PQQ) biosynthesis protein C